MEDDVFEMVNSYPPERVAHDAVVAIKDFAENEKHFNLTLADKDILTHAYLILKRCANEHS